MTLRDAGDGSREPQAREAAGRCEDGPLQSHAEVPAEGAPSTEWLASFLAAERASMARQLEQRHNSILRDLRRKKSMGEGDLAIAEPLTGTTFRSESTSSSATKETVVVGLDAVTPRPPPQLPPGGPPPPGSADTPVQSQEVSRLTERRPSVSSLSDRLFIEEAASAAKENERTLLKIVQSPKFEVAIACITMGFAAIMALQIQYSGMDIGHALQYRGYTAPSEDVHVGIDVIDYIFGVIFTVELALKLAGLRAQWFRDPWNYLDAVIVCLWFVEKLSQVTLNLPTDGNVLRLARLFRVLRLLKVLRTLQGFDSLYLLLTTLKGSINALAWSCVLLFVTQMLIAMIFWLLLKEAYFGNENLPLSERRDVFEYFGTFSRTMLTMFEMTLANWPPVCRLLAENVSEWFTVFCIFHKLTMGFAVIGVINGVFMQETFKVAATDDKIMLRQREREVKTQSSKLKRLFDAADDSGDGVVDRDEFAQIMQDKDILLWLSSMEITVRDADKLYALLDVDGDEELTCEEFVRGAMGMRGGAKSVDVLEMKSQVAQIWGKLMEDDAKQLQPCLPPPQQQQPAPPPQQHWQDQQQSHRARIHTAPAAAIHPLAVHPFQVDSDAAVGICAEAY